MCMVEVFLHRACSEEMEGGEDWIWGAMKIGETFLQGHWGEGQLLSITSESLLPEEEFEPCH